MIVQAQDVTTPGYTQARTPHSAARAVATGALRPFHVHVNPDKTVARVEFSIAGKGDNARRSTRSRHCGTT